MTALTSGQSTLANYAYDANGNNTCRVEGNSIYKQTYNAENRISSIQKLRSGACADANPPLETKWDFAYDGDGVRTATLTTPFDTNGASGSATLTVYYFGGAYEVSGAGGFDANNKLVFTTTPTNVKKYYSFGGQTIIRDANVLKYMITDHLGSVVAVTSDRIDINTPGTLISEQRYLPFGGERTNIDPITQTDYGYTGQRKLDSGMGGLMDYKARFYSPYLGRFIQPDTLIPGPGNPQAYNRYTYVFGNPIKYNDPSGHGADCGIGMGCVSSYIPSTSGGGSNLNGNGNGNPSDPDEESSEGIKDTNDAENGTDLTGSEHYYAGCNYSSCTKLNYYHLTGMQGDNLQDMLYRMALGEPYESITTPMLDTLVDILMDAKNVSLKVAGPIAAIPGAITQAISNDFKAIAILYQPVSNASKDQKPEVDFVVMSDIKFRTSGILLNSNKIGVFWQSSNAVSPLVIIPSYLNYKLSTAVGTIRKTY